MSQSNNPCVFSTSGSFGPGTSSPNAVLQVSSSSSNPSLVIGGMTLNNQGITFPNGSILTTGFMPANGLGYLSREDFEDYYMIVYDLHAKVTTKLNPSDLFSVYSSMQGYPNGLLFPNVKTFLTHLYKTLNEPDYKIELLIIPR